MYIYVYIYIYIYICIYIYIHIYTFLYVYTPVPNQTKGVWGGPRPSNEHKCVFELARNKKIEAK